MPTLPARTRHLAFTMLFIAIALVFLATAAHHAYTMDFRPLAAFCLPVLAVFFTFTSLLYIRGNSVADRRNKVRTLFAAETAMRATLCYLMGVAVGGSLYGLFELAGFAFDPLQPHWNGLWLLALGCHTLS